MRNVRALGFILLASACGGDGDPSSEDAIHRTHDAGSVTQAHDAAIVRGGQDGSVFPTNNDRTATAVDCSRSRGVWRLTFTRTPSGKRCTEAYQAGLIEDITAQPMTLNLDSPPEKPSCTVRAPMPGTCSFRWWYGCTVRATLLNTTAPSYQRELEGMVISSNRFEGTASLNFLGGGTACKENYTVVGTPL